MVQPSAPRLPSKVLFDAITTPVGILAGWLGEKITGTPVPTINLSSPGAIGSSFQDGIRFTAQLIRSPVALLLKPGVEIIANTPYSKTWLLVDTILTWRVAKKGWDVLQTPNRLKHNQKIQKEATSYKLRGIATMAFAATNEYLVWTRLIKQHTIVILKDHYYATRTISSIFDPEFSELSFEEALNKFPNNFEALAGLGKGSAFFLTASASAMLAWNVWKEAESAKQNPNLTEKQGNYMEKFLKVAACGLGCFSIWNTIKGWDSFTAPHIPS